VQLGVQVHRAGRCLYHRLLHHAPEEEPRCHRADPRQDRPRLRRPEHPAGDDEGHSTGLQQGYAGGQGSHLRCGGYAGAVPQDRHPHAGHHEDPACQHAPRCRQGLYQRHRLRRLPDQEGDALPGCLQADRLHGVGLHCRRQNAGGTDPDPVPDLQSAV